MKYNYICFALEKESRKRKILCNIQSDNSGIPAKQMFMIGNLSNTMDGVSTSLKTPIDKENETLTTSL